AFLLWQHTLQLWHIYAVSVVASVGVAFQWPAIAASMTLLVPREQLGRSNGMLQFSESASVILAPVLAGVLLSRIGLPGLIFVDFASFLVAVAATLLTPIPSPPASTEGTKAKGSLLSEAAFGWKYIVARPGLVGMLSFFLVINYVLPVSGVLQ